jgi:outer membrane cobalamin receptor
MKVMQCRARVDGGLGFSIYSNYLELGGKYEYAYSYASDYVTYQPDHRASGYFNLIVKRFDIQFSTGYRSKLYVSPFTSQTIAWSLIGSLSVQFKVLDTFYLYGRIDNIYNRTYHAVYGYPEPGRTIMGGLRIII